MSLTQTVALLNELKQFPSGATPRDLAARMRRNQTGLSAQLGKLAMYGVIDRERVKDEHTRISYRYHTRPAAHA